MMLSDGVVSDPAQTMDQVISQLRSALRVARLKAYASFTESASRGAVLKNLDTDEVRIGNLAGYQRDYVLSGRWTPAKWSEMAKIIADDITYQGGVAVDSSLILVFSRSVAATLKDAGDLGAKAMPWLAVGAAVVVLLMLRR